MSMSFGSQKSKSKTKETRQSDPWDETIPYIKDFLSSQVGPRVGAPMGPTAAQTGAFGQLEANAGAGNPYAGQIDALAGDLFGTQSRAGQVGDAFSAYKAQLDPVASGANLNLESNPYIAAMLKKATDDASTKVNELFAGAGRSFSGANMAELGRGITEAQTPILANLYQFEQGRTDAAQRDLYGGARTGATTQADLDAQAAQLRGAGVDVGNAALDAKNYGPNQILELEQQMKMLPYDEMAKLAAILFPAGQLGSQETGTSKGTGKQSSFGLGLKLFG